MIIDKLKIRNGFPNLVKKLGKEPVTIGFLGGSVSHMKRGWRLSLQEWFDETFIVEGGNKFIDVTMGGVGSATGVFLTKEKLFPEKPDLVFIEFSINDQDKYLTPIEDTCNFVDLIIQIIRSSNNNADICFVYMLYSGQETQLRKGNLTHGIAAHEKIADYYGITSINIAKSIEEIDRSGLYTIETGKDISLFRDYCHHSELGVKMCTSILSKSIDGILKYSLRCPAKEDIGKYSSFSDSRWSSAKIIRINKDMINGVCSWLDKDIPNFNTNRFLSLPAKTEIKFSFKGIYFGFYFISGPNSPILSIKCNNSIVDINTFDEFCYYERINSLILPISLFGLPDVINGCNVSLTVSNTQPDMSVARKPVSIDKYNPKFDVSHILLIGYLIDGI